MLLLTLAIVGQGAEEVEAVEVGAESPEASVAAGVAVADVETLEEVPAVTVAIAVAIGAAIGAATVAEHGAASTPTTRAPFRPLVGLKHPPVLNARPASSNASCWLAGSWAASSYKPKCSNILPGQRWKL